MENFEKIETIDEIVDTFGASVFGETEAKECYESFPEKDRSKAAIRRKKTYFKSQNRLNRIRKVRGYNPFDENENVIKGMLKKTNVVTPHFDPDPYTSINLKAVCRDLDVKEMIKDYYEEAV